MNAIVAVRNNTAGLLNPTQVQRRETAKQLLSALQAKADRSSVPVFAAANAQPAGAAKADGATGATNDGGTATREVNQELDKDTFLQLLVLQMQSQDPLSPMDNTDMIAQLAQFTSLEQMNNLNESFELMSGNMDQLNFITANSLIGRTVAGVDINGEVAAGTVSKVHLDGSMVHLTVGEHLMSMAGVMEIE